MARELLKNSNLSSILRVPRTLSLDDLEALGHKLLQPKEALVDVRLSCVSFRLNNLFSMFRRHWPNGIMHYTIDDSFTSSDRVIIAAGMQMVMDVTCIK